MRRMYSTPLLACLLLLCCSAGSAATVSSCPYDFQAAACLIPPSCYDNTSVSDPGNCCWSVSSAFIFAGIKYSNRTGNAFLPEANASACSTGFVSYLLHNRLVRRSLILSGDRCNLNTTSAAGVRPCTYPTLAGIRSAVNLTDPTRICTAAKDLTLDQNSCTRCQNAVIASTMALLSLTKSKEFVPCGMAATIGIWATFPDSQRFRSYVLCMVQVLDNVGNLGTSDLIPSPPSLPPVTTQRPEKRSGKKTAAKTAAGVASAGFLTLVALFILGLLVVRNRRRFSDDDDSTATIKTQLPIEGMYIFTKKELNAATNGFDRRRLLGEGGAGKVYLGTLPSGQSVAIKRISQRRKFNEFYREVEILAKLRHRNLTTIVGYCLQKREHVLVYEYMGGGNLSRALFHGELTWHQRVKIAVDVAEALTYLHGVRVVHRDVKPGNVLLAENGAAKLSDFGLSKFVPLDFSHVSTEVKGTFGYLDPNCFPTGHVSEASDVYSFGIVLLELVTGKRAVVPTASGGAESIVNAAREIADVEGAEAELTKVADQRLGPEVEPGSIGEVFWVARRCVLPYQQERPKMEEVLRVLKKVLAELEKVGPKKAEVGRGGPPDTVSDESSGTPSSRVSRAALHSWSL